MSTKAAVKDLLRRLPENCTFEDVQYHLYVLQAVKRGRHEIASGKGIPHDHVARDARRAWRRRSEK